MFLTVFLSFPYPYHTIAENLRIWKWHMAVAFHFSPSTDVWNLLPYPSTDSPRYSQQQKEEGFKTLKTWCFPSSFLYTSGAAPVTQPGTTRIHNRGPKYRTFSYIYDIPSIIAGNQSAHWNGHVLYVVHQVSQPAALGRVLCGPGSVFHKIQCVMNIEAWVTRHYMTKGK